MTDTPQTTQPTQQDEPEEHWLVVDPLGNPRSAFTLDELKSFERRGRDALLRAHKLGVIPLGVFERWTAFPFRDFIMGNGHHNAMTNLAVLLDAIEELCGKMEDDR